jgi:hypothetical protein
MMTLKGTPAVRLAALAFASQGRTLEELEDFLAATVRTPNFKTRIELKRLNITG